MKPTIKLSQTVINRLSALKETCLGNLYGVFYNKTQYIIGLYLNSDDSNYPIVQHLPTEVELCGVFEASNGTFDHTQLKNTIGNVFITDNPLYLKVIIGAKNEIEAYFIVHDRLEAAKTEILEVRDMYSQFVYIRLRAQLPLICNIDKESVKDALQDLRKQFGSGKVVFHLEKQNVFLLCNDVESGVTGASGDCTVDELMKLSNSDQFVNKGCKGLDVLQANMLKKVSQDNVIDSKKSHAPIVCVDKKKHECLIMVLSFDALSMVHRSMPLNSLFEILVESTCRNIDILKTAIVKRFQQSGGDHSKISYPQVFHFYPRPCGHFITKVYAKNETENSLESDRKQLHENLLLPLREPLFRRSNQYIFRGDTLSNSPLINPHETLKPTGNGGEIALVKGKYEYYHYCQNNMDDDGWGCAYRSLQTLASWFHLQGYTEKSVPTYKDIQTCLVDIGDKTASFIGSRQWIGSTEVNFVLNSLLNITCKILYCSSGEEIASKGPELINHFNVHGSPIMIGGGVLAHTILGVDYNHQTGGIKFLILDPHYTGSENLQVILSKGWCGWKGVNFWDKTAYYNMCLPQVPHCV